VIDATLNVFAHYLHFNSQELPCFVGGVTHLSPLEGGHGVGCFFEIKELLGVEEIS
jgi:hypothetical protein